jgi:hypothetical protein
MTKSNEEHTHEMKQKYCFLHLAFTSTVTVLSFDLPVSQEPGQALKFKGEVRPRLQLIASTVPVANHRRSNRKSWPLRVHRSGALPWPPPTEGGGSRTVEPIVIASRQTGHF